MRLFFTTGSIFGQTRWPIAGLHGRIHESREAQKLGRAMRFDPGSEYSEGVLRGVLMEFEPNRPKGWQFTNG